MINIMIDSLKIGWARHSDYGNKLVADLSQDQMIVQPQPGMNHPSWVLSHLNAYHGPLVSMLSGEPFDDPKDHRFGMLSKPEADASVYESKQTLLTQYNEGHERVVAALESAGEAGLHRAMSLERWKGVFPTVGSALGYLMLAHEGVHLGQLSAWRRVQGLPSV